MNKKKQHSYITYEGSWEEGARGGVTEDSHWTNVRFGHFYSPSLNDPDFTPGIKQMNEEH